MFPKLHYNHEFKKQLLSEPLNLSLLNLTRSSLLLQLIQTKKDLSWIWFCWGWGRNRMYLLLSLSKNIF